MPAAAVRLKVKLKIFRLKIVKSSNSILNKIILIKGEIDFFWVVLYKKIYCLKLLK